MDYKNKKLIFQDLVPFYLEITTINEIVVGVTSTLHIFYLSCLPDIMP